MQSLVVFLDLGGVIIEKEQQIAQWNRLVGEYFVNLLGGTAEAWTAAHQVVSTRLSNWEEGVGQAPADFVSFYRDYQLRRVRGMCELVGAPPPPEEECLQLAEEAIGSITSRIHAALPGAVEALRLLHQQGYPLHLASGACSRELSGYLEAMGVRHYFRRLYGADVINTFKEGPAYYERLFADVGIDPTEAVVVDDNLQALHWAAQTGAQTVLISPLSPPEHPVMARRENPVHLPSLAHLLTWLNLRVPPGDQQG
jgi:HAD superfamily hydrolase (TIGR01509 family)